MTVDVLAFGAHPDDIELTCAGTLVKLIRSGYTVGLIDMTVGERGSWGTADERKREAQEAASVMQVSFRRCLGFSDGQIDIGPAGVRTVVEAIRFHRPRAVFAPHWRTLHPDHLDTSRIVTRACFYSGLPNWEADGEAHRPDGVVYYMSRLPFRPSFIVDVTDSFEVRLKAIRAYRSQLYKTGPAPRGLVHTEWFLEAVIGRARHFGALIKVEFGEPFFVREPLLVADPISVLPSLFFKEKETE